MRAWLKAPDSSKNQERATDLRLKGTGAWFLQGWQYLDWKTAPTCHLWLYGSAGSGKSILTSGIIEDLARDCKSDPAKALAFFYFDFNNSTKQSPSNMLSSLTHQLLHSVVQVPQTLIDDYASCQDGGQAPSRKQLQIMLKALIQCSITSYIVVDALDECTSRAELMNCLREIASYEPKGVNSKLHILFTSRDEVDIEEELDYLPESARICIQTRAVDHDIQAYVINRLDNDKGFSRWRRNTELRAEIKDTITSGAKGMFRWAACQLDALCNCKTVAKVRQALQELPDTLDETYSRILCGIDAHDSEYARKILLWLAFSEAPLMLSQLVGVTGIHADIDEESYFEPDDVLPDETDVRRICSSLVTIYTDRHPDAQWDSVDEAPFARLAHFSVKEYLLSSRIIEGSAADFSLSTLAADDALARSCTAYLLHFQGKPYKEPGHMELYIYAARFWTTHARNVKDPSSTLRALTMRMLLLKPVRDDVWHTSWANIYISGKGQTTFCDWQHIARASVAPGNDDASPLSWTAYLGLTYAVLEQLKHLIETLGLESTVLKQDLQSSLWHAAREGHLQIVDILLESGANVHYIRQGDRALTVAVAGAHYEIAQHLIDYHADVNFRGEEKGTTALLAAVNSRSRKTLDLVRLLLDRGADVNIQGETYGTALHSAASMIPSNIEVVQLLLDRGADINIHGGTHGTALHGAASHTNNIRVVQLLLDRGADIDTQGGNNGTALQAAARTSGNIEVVQLLLTHGADVKVQGGEYGTALQAAAYACNFETIKLMLDRGADVNAHGGTHGTALQISTDRPHVFDIGVVKLLLERGADVNVREGDGGTLLLRVIEDYNRRYAVKRGLELVKLLTDHGADVNVQRGRGRSRTALQAAASNHSLEVVQLLLDCGAQTNVQGDVCETALQIAARNGNVAIVQLLLDRGADTNVHGGQWGTALQAAAIWDNLEVARLLLGRGAALNVLRGKYGTALQAAARLTEPTMVRLLLDRSADPNIQGGEYGTALQAAAHMGNLRSAQLLLQSGANVNIQGGSHGTALRAAAFRVKGDCAIAQLLIARGADVNSKGGLDETALHVAASNNDVELVQLLVHNGADVNLLGGKYGSALVAVTNSGRGGEDEQLEIVKLLLRHGVDVNVRSDKYGSALDGAFRGSSRKVRQRIVDALLEAGADPSQPEPPSVAPQHNTLALYNGKYRICDGCEKSVVDVHLHCSICNGGDFDLCEDCIDSGKLCPGKGHHWLVKRYIKDGKVVTSTTERIAPHSAGKHSNFKEPSQLQARLAKIEETAKEMPSAFGTKTVAEEPRMEPLAIRGQVVIGDDGQSATDAHQSQRVDGDEH